VTAVEDGTITVDVVGTVAVADRRHAATNPDAFFFGCPITLEDHQTSRMTPTRRGARLHRRRRDRARRPATAEHTRRPARRGLIHGMNGIAEAVRQVRGTSVNQVEDPHHVLVTAGTGVPTSGLILSR